MGVQAISAGFKKVWSEGLRDARALIGHGQGHGRLGFIRGIEARRGIILGKKRRVVGKAALGGHPPKPKQNLGKIRECQGMPGFGHINAR